MCDDAEQPTDSVCDDAEQPTDSVCDDAEQPTDSVLDDTEQPTDSVLDDAEQPTDSVCDDPEQPTVQLLSAQGQPLYEATVAPIPQGQDRVVHFRQMLETEERFLITKVLRENIREEDYNEDHTVGCYIKWELSRVKHAKAMKPSDLVNLFDANGVKQYTARFDPFPSGQERIVRSHKLADKEERFVITHVFLNNIPPAEYDADITVNSYVKWDVSRVRRTKTERVSKQRYLAKDETGKNAANIVIIDTAEGEIANDEVCCKVITSYSEEFPIGKKVILKKLQITKIQTKAVDKKKCGRGYKRTRSPDRWVRNAKKAKRNSEPKKPMTEQFQCTCRYTECKNLTLTERTEIHTNFWKIGDFDKQNNFILRNITVNKKKRGGTDEGVDITDEPGRRVSRKRRGTKLMSRKFYLSDKKVCKPLFLDTLSVSNGRVDRLLQKTAHGEFDVSDKRGKHKKRGFGDEICKNVHTIIDKLPKYEVHYLSEAKSTSLDVYLEPDCTLKAAYNLFTTLNIENGAVQAGAKQPSETWFYDEIKRRFPHLKIKTPKKDVCNTCTTMTLNEKYEDLKQHKAEAGVMLDQQRVDFNDQNCITFDLMQVQALPYLNVGKAFYSRKMWMYNFGINCPKTGESYIYTWNENEGYRGPVEICSLVFMHIKKHYQDAQYVILWSDSTGSQNRNFHMIAMILRLFNDMPNLEYVIHRFPIVGHSYLPNDRDFGVIANAKKKKEQLYSSQEYIRMIEAARKKPSPFKVVKAGSQDFKSFEDSVNFKKLSVNQDTTGQRFTLFDIHEMKYSRGLFGFEFKHLTSDQVYRSCDLGPQSSRSRRPSQPLFDNLESLYPATGVPISSAKYNDIQDLLKYVPPIHHNDYKNLKHSSKRKNTFK